MDARRERLGLGGIVLATILVHLRSLFAGFAYDDFPAIVRHPGVMGPFSLSGIFAHDWFGHAFGTPELVGTYRPVVTASFRLDATLGGGGAALFHVTNLVTYVVLLLVANRVLRRMSGEALSSGARLVALFAFAMLAIHEDVVPSLAGRAELFATLFSLLALEAAMLGRPVLVLIALLLALGSKETALPVAFITPLLALRRVDRRRFAGVALAALGAIAVFAAVRFHRLPFGISKEWYLHNPLLLASAGGRLRGAFETVFHYAAHTTTATDLCPDYSYAAIVPEASFGPRTASGALLVVLAVLVLIVSVRARNWLVAEVLALLAASYVIVSHVVVPASALVADRWFFHPSLWLVTLVALGADALARRRVRLARILSFGGLGFAALQGIVAWTIVPAWHDNLTLSARAVRMCPTSIGARILRASSTFGAGQLDETAWAALIASVLHARFPRPIDEDALPGAWEELPVAERVRRLQTALGGRLAFERYRESARGALIDQGMESVEHVLATW